ncbi:unnamed protein product [Pleuronectes platessa]|uniref:Uncharacterized protein n=1 Tax=Pleuronectes platessa TaxID=8262 RepID=A0A9N7YTK4_PLEPL|nr:unnamed protein product [Pleuronectes platessa]
MCVSQWLTCFQMVSDRCVKAHNLWRNTDKGCETQSENKRLEPQLRPEEGEGLRGPARTRGRPPYTSSVEWLNSVYSVAMSRVWLCTYGGCSMTGHNSCFALIKIPLIRTHEFGPSSCIHWCPGSVVLAHPCGPGSAFLRAGAGPAVSLNHGGDFRSLHTPHSAPG